MDNDATSKLDVIVVNSMRRFYKVEGVDDAHGCVMTLPNGWS